MESFWNKDKTNKFEEIRENIEIDTCIIGGGLTGTSVGYKLSKSQRVAIVERERICSHTSGCTTGKITSQHGLFYNYLINSKGKEFAKKYLEANEIALKNIEKIIEKENIDCDFEKQDAYVFTESEDQIKKIETEYEAVQSIDEEKSELLKKVDLPLQNIRLAIKFKDQAQFNPVKYVDGLVSNIIKNNGVIFEDSKAINIEKSGSKYVVYVNNNKITAKNVVIATRYPFISMPGYYFLKMYQSTSFAVVADVNEKLFEGMYINSEIPTLSFRTIKDGDKKLLLAVGYDYKTGTGGLTNGYKELEKVIRRMYPASQFLYRWSAEDCISLDKYPYIGEFSALMSNVYVATGFNKWGITSSNIAAEIITDKIMNKENKYEKIFKARRMEPIKNIKEVGNMLKESTNGIVVSRLTLPEKPKCTHLGCELHFNNVDKIWECPCHGSKFTENGKVIETPANKDLPKGRLPKVAKGTVLLAINCQENRPLGNLGNRPFGNLGTSFVLLTFYLIHLKTIFYECSI
ncbi:MAG: FAD-dependent oxidoreductase [Clostridia bacterium]|nr:FAD-dependent oxidoreductase [Clostridia bacterium]